MSSCGNSEVWVAWDCSRMLGNAQERMGNALGCLNSLWGLTIVGVVNGFNVEYLGFIHRSKQKGRMGWQTRCRGGGMSGYEKAWKPRK